MNGLMYFNLFFKLNYVNNKKRYGLTKEKKMVEFQNIKRYYMVNY